MCGFKICFSQNKDINILNKIEAKKIEKSVFFYDHKNQFGISKVV